MCLSSLGKCTFRSFARFCAGSLLFLLLSCKNFFSIWYLTLTNSMNIYQQIQHSNFSPDENTNGDSSSEAARPPGASNLISVVADFCQSVLELHRKGAAQRVLCVLPPHSTLSRQVTRSSLFPGNVWAHLEGRAF